MDYLYLGAGLDIVAPLSNIFCNGLTCTGSFTCPSPFECPGFRCQGTFSLSGGNHGPNPPPNCPSQGPQPWSAEVSG